MRKVFFNPIFRSANETRCRYRAMKGSAGSGKSVNIAQDYIVKLMQPMYAGANLLVIRKIGDWNRQSTYAELVSAIYRICGSRAEAYWDIKQSPLALRCKTTGNEVLFRGMKDDRQREGVKSVTFRRGKLTWIWAEEATELDEADIDILDDRLRGELTNPNLYYQITLSFNPVSITHWIKAKCFDVRHPAVFTHHSTYQDNLFIDPAYHARMLLRKEQDPEGYRVYGLGDWGLLGGQFFSMWRDSLHVVKPFPIPDGWMRFRSMDWGSYHPYCVGWYAVDYDGNLWKYRELYGYGGKANVGTKETAAQVAARIAEMEKHERRQMRYGVLDNACWASSGTTGPTIAEEINKVLVASGCVTFGPSSKGREQMAEQIKLRLVGHTKANGEQVPAIRFFDTCFHTIRTLPMLTHDKRQPEKIDTNGEDHCFVAGTMITTLSGRKPIEAVTTDDLVLTRCGFKKVVRSFCSFRNAAVQKVSFSDGRSIIGTGNHPVYVMGKGFVRLDSLSPGDRIISEEANSKCRKNNLRQRKVSCLTALLSGDTQTRSIFQIRDIIEQMEDCVKRVYRIYTTRSGSIIMEKYRRDIIFITRMAIRLIIPLIILKRYRVESTCRSTIKKEVQANTSEYIFRRCRKRQKHGINLPKALRGIVSTGKRLLHNKKKEKLYEFASLAAKLMKHWNLQKISVSSVQRNVKQNGEETTGWMMKREFVPCAVNRSGSIGTARQKRAGLNAVGVLAVSNAGKADVYNLTVSEQPEFFANGILVHNCSDETGYACLSRPWTPEKPKKDAYKRDAWETDTPSPSAWAM